MGRASRAKAEQRENRRRGEELRRREREESVVRAADGRRRGCLFCRESDRDFVSVEHIVPEGMGNTTLVLPNGVVCDRCNNGPLSRLDRAFFDLLPIKARAITLGLAGKTGKVPTLNVTNGTLSNPSGNNIEFQHLERRALRETKRHPDGRVELKLKMQGGRRLTASYGAELSSALLKIAFELSWLDHGERMLGAEFDHVRDAVFGRPRHGYLAVARRGNADQLGSEISYVMHPLADTREGVGVVGCFLGTALGTDSVLEAPVVPFDGEDVLMLSFGSSDFKRSAA